MRHQLRPLFDRVVIKELEPDRVRQSGLLVPPDDAAALADALVQLLEDPALASRLGAGGRARAVESFSWDAVASRALSLYRPLIERGR